MNNKPWKFISDVDGVLTDGSFVYSQNGKICKVFGAHDNDGVKLLKQNGIKVQFITADSRGYEITKKRITDMNCSIQLVPQLQRAEYIYQQTVRYNIIFMGDGINDISALRIADIAIIPNNARSEVKQSLYPGLVFITPSNGGSGAFLDAALYVINYLDNTSEIVESEESTIKLPKIYETATQLMYDICLSYISPQIDHKITSFIQKLQVMHTKNPEFKIVGVGAGRVGYALRAFIMRLNHFGFNASFIGDTNVPALTSDDMLIVASTSGSTPTISYYTLVGKNQQKCFIVAITGDTDSFIARQSNIHIPLNLQLSEKYLMKTYGQLALNVLFDSIVIEMINSNLFKSIEQIERNHSHLE